MLSPRSDGPNAPPASSSLEGRFAGRLRQLPFLIQKFWVDSVLNRQPLFEFEGLYRDLVLWHTARASLGVIGTHYRSQTSHKPALVRFAVSCVNLVSKSPPLILILAPFPLRYILVTL